MPLATFADIVALERTPLAERNLPRSTFAMLRGSAERHPDRLAIRFIEKGAPDEPARDLTYRDLFAQVVRAANLFRRLGATPQNCVSLLLPLMPEAFVAMIGAQTSGMANPINFLLEATHIAALLRGAQTRVLLAPDPEWIPGIWPKVEAIRREVPTLSAVLRVGGPRVRPDIDALSFEAELEREAGAALTFARDIGPSDVASLFHTGGTTAAPKLARHTHGGLAVQAWSNAQVWDLTHEDVLLHGLPIFHVGGANCGGLSPLSVGATIVLMTASGYRNPHIVANFWAHVERFRASTLAMVPTSWGAVMNAPSDGFDLTSVRLCHAGGAAMPVELARAVERRLGRPVVEGWGMTELHGFGSMNPAAGEPRIGSVGFRTPYTELIVASVKDGRVQAPAATNEIGRLLARGPQAFGGYLDEGQDRAAWIEPAADDTPPTWSGGRWLDTGDLGRFDEDGYLWLTGRAKDVIIRGGHNIDPLSIEEVLHQHEGVEAVAAVGRPDLYAGELPMAFVQLKPGAGVTSDELRQFARERVSERAATPVDVVVLGQMPLTGVGKIFKPELRRLATQLAVEQALAALPEGASGFAVEVVADVKHGLVANVQQLRPLSSERKDAVRRLLDGFQVRCQLL
jgi:fatty-acyl-CoA synthase